jgi:DNA repair photolyase
MVEPQTIFVGMDTDPYQPIEEYCQHTRETLELLSGRGMAACILTKSDLVTRDIDMLSQMPGSSVGFSFAFQDEETRRLFEPHAPSNARRLRALQDLKTAGVETYALISPLFPHITNAVGLIQQLTALADTIWIYRLSMASPAGRDWQNTETILSDHFPCQAPAIEEITFQPKHDFWIRLRHILEGNRFHGLNLRIEI